MHEQLAPRRTKIVGTLGPASNTPEVIEGLIRAGMDVARLNFSHGSHDDHRKSYEAVRRASDRAGRPIAILQDLQGPKIRLGTLDGVITLPAGEEVLLSSDDSFTGTRPRLPTTYERLATDVRPGEQILLADGALELQALEVRGPDVLCKILIGGKVSSRKGLNMPGSHLRAPCLTEKDLADLEFGLALGVDYVALSFVRAAHDVIQLREIMDKLGRRVPIVSKIEKPQAVDSLEAIIDVSDAIMVARGDLGVELPPERVPTVQRRAIRMASQRGKGTIVATQMLVSMTAAPRPTHAEVSDVANAVFDGADAVMLSEETAAGQFPIKAVETMASVAHAADASRLRGEQDELLVPELMNSHAGAIARAAVLTARDLSARAIVSFTHQGLGPRLLGHFRPECEILGFASTQEAVRRMALFWGVRPIQVPPPRTLEDLVQMVDRVAVETGALPRGATVVITSKMPFGEVETTNTLKLHTVGGGEAPATAAERSHS